MWDELSWQVKITQCGVLGHFWQDFVPLLFAPSRFVDTFRWNVSVQETAHRDVSVHETAHRAVSTPGWRILTAAAGRGGRVAIYAT